jgi:predicted ester cyclase
MTTSADIYRAFIDAVNRQDLGAADQFVDESRYRESCIGFTRGFVDWEQSKASIRRVWEGLPDLRAELPHIMADGDIVLAHGTVRGTATGRLFGAPATKRRCEANFFDYVRIDDGADRRTDPASRCAHPDAPALRQSSRPCWPGCNVLAPLTGQTAPRGRPPRPAAWPPCPAPRAVPAGVPPDEMFMKPPG